MKIKFIWIALTVIVFIAALLRIYQLGNIPPSPNWDEVSLGYNAYSIMLTGRDEYGVFLPPVLRSFDDYKPALYTYLIIPFIPLFDLTAFTVRLPSAIFGVIGVVASFFLIRLLFPTYKYRDQLALLTAFLLAISPIAIQVSRIAFETNVGMVFNLLAALFFLVALKRPWFIFLAALFAALSIYTYQSEKVFTPLFMLALLLIYRKEFFEIPKKFILGGIAFGLILMIPMTQYLLTHEDALLRAQSTSVLADQTTFLRGNIERLEHSIEEEDRLGIILNNRRFEYFKSFVSGYLSHYDANWLFIKGDIKRHHAPDMGLLYHFELPFLLVGIYLLVFGRFPTKTKLLIFAWFLLAPLPAAFTTGVPHALRTLNFLPTWQIFTALGLIFATVWITGIKYKLLTINVKFFVLTFLVLTFTFNFIYYVNQYFSQQNYFYSSEWQYGWEEAVEYVKVNGDEYDTVIVSSKQPLDQAYMFFAFFLKYPPSEYQNSPASQQFGFFDVNKSFGKYEFVPEINWEEHSIKENTLIIGIPSEIPDGAVVKEIRNLDGTLVIRIASTR